MKSLRYLIILGGCLLAGVANAATSVSQFGITWTFSKDQVVGQYANGDYYVVGPVTIIGISPASTLVSGRTINGSQINPPSGPGMTQGYDSAMYSIYGPAFDAKLNVARPNGANLSAVNPLVVPVGSSLLSTISVPTASARPQLSDAAILTIVDKAPPSGSFRPSPYGTNKVHSWNVSQMDRTVFQSLAPVVGTPSLAANEKYFERPWLEYHTSWQTQYTTPVNNGPDYGQQVGQARADAMLLLHLNFTQAQKEKLLISLVQQGIDTYGAVAFSNGFWMDLGGNLLGRKSVVVLAGLVLNDPNIIAVGQRKVFSEDLQTFKIATSDVGRPLDHSDGRPREEYIASDVGLFEAGEQHTHAPNRDGRNWETMWYRDIIGSADVGQALAIRLMRGGVEAWSWEPFFGYADRYMLNPIAGSNPVRPFQASMWAAYRNSTPVPIPTPTPIPDSSVTITITVKGKFSETPTIQVTTP